MGGMGGLRAHTETEPRQQSFQSLTVTATDRDTNRDTNRDCNDFYGLTEPVRTATGVFGGGVMGRY